MGNDRIEKEKQFHNERFTEEIRQNAWKYYSIESFGREYFQQKIFYNVRSKSILELGCGKSTFATKLCKKGANVIGIDISDVAINYSKENYTWTGKEGSTEFTVMNAEELDFEDNSFDKIVGSSIIHHLELKKSIPGFARVLKPDGLGVFLEPLGHNPLINLYRKFTPKLRSEDEHPLMIHDLEFIKQYFSDVNLKYFYLTTFFALPFRNSPFFNSIVNLFNKVDNYLFKLKSFRKYAWQCVIVVSKPIKSNISN